MAKPVDIALRCVRDAEQLFKSVLRSTFENATPSEAPKLFAVLADFRSACRAALLLDYAQTSPLETALWEAHTAVNGRFREVLKKINRKSKPVEWRVVAEQYKAFVKHSQVFYRQLLRSLDLKIGGVPGLHEAAQTWKQDAAIIPETSPDTETLDESVKQRIIVSCHNSLMHLGDLSRWRHAEKLDHKGDRSPKEAVGYYELAEIILPYSESPQHQLGVLAGNDGKAFRAIYHFYRSLCAPKPHPNGKRNLDLEFRKVTAWKTQDLIASCLPSDKNVAVATLKAWFIILHTKTSAGNEFPGRTELENEVIGRMSAVPTEGGNTAVTLRRMVHMNIAAEGYWRKKLALKPIAEASVAFSFSSFLSLNVRTSIALLQSFETALEEDLREDVNAKSIKPTTTAMPSACQRVLPSILLYALWLVTNWTDLHLVNNQATLAASVRDLWRSFAAVLALLVQRYPLSSLPTIDHLLPEGEDTLGFVPVHCANTEDFWSEDGKVRSRYPAGLRTKEQNALENLARVKTIIACGVRIAVTESKCPLQLEQKTSRFFYEDPNIPAELLPGHSHIQENQDPTIVGAERLDCDIQVQLPFAAPAQSPAMPAVTSSHVQEEPVDVVAPREPFDGTIDMSEMVAQLTTEDEQCYSETGRMPPTPPANTFDDVVMESNKDFGVSTGELDKASSPHSSKVARSRPQSGLHSPAIPQFPSLPGLYGTDSIWQNKPSPGPTFAGDGWSSPQLQQGAQPSPWNQPSLPHAITDANGGLSPSRHSSYPEHSTASGSAFGQYGQQQQQQLTSDYSVTPPAFSTGSRTPTFGATDYRRQAFGNAPAVPPGLNSPFALAAPMARNLSSSSHIFDSSRPASRRQMNSSWNRTPPNGQGG